MEVREPLQSVNQQTLNIPANQVIHWYDFICPFCYVAQGRNRWLRRRSIGLVELPYQAHPEVPHGGLPMGKRQGPMYERLEQEARLVDLPLQWPSRLPNSRQALFGAEWIRRHEPSKFEQFQRAVFAAHFALGKDINDPSVIDRYAKAQDVDTEGLRKAIVSGEASRAVSECESFGHLSGIRGTPAWLIQGQLIEGLQPLPIFERAARLVTSVVDSRTA